MLHAQSDVRRGLHDRLWEMIAYLSRYAHQPVSVLKELRLEELIRMCNETSKIVAEERSE